MTEYAKKNVVTTVGAGGSKNSPTIRPGLPSNSETFTERVTRLCLHRRLGEIGVGQWRPVMDRHRSLTDQQMLDEMSKLERRDLAS